jgi:PIN domain nuclease of toxin-antitoxin system
MSFLLDTHVWLWMRAQPERLRGEVRELVTDPVNDLLLSTASSWEIAIKYALGKLPLPMPPRDYVPSRLHEDGVEPLLVSNAHALQVADLPRIHGDPFDRMLIAQAQLETLSVVTADSIFSEYDVAVVPAT